MDCPAHPGTEMVDHIREGIEVRRCPDCRGLWLSHTDVERLLDLADVQSPGPHIGARAHQEPMSAAPEPAMRARHRKRHGSFAQFLEDVLEVFE